jgi:hypothetical protein
MDALWWERMCGVLSLIFMIVFFVVMHLRGLRWARRHFRRLESERRASGLDSRLSLKFDPAYHAITTEVERYFQEAACGVDSFPVLAEDDIEEVYRIDVEEVLEDCLERCGRRLPDKKRNTPWVPIRTVADLIGFLLNCPREDG